MNVLCHFGLHQKELRPTEPKSNGEEVNFGVVLVCPGCGKTHQKLDFKLRVAASPDGPKGVMDLGLHIGHAEELDVP